MKPVSEMPIEEVNILCVMPLVIFYALTCEAEEDITISPFTIIKSIEHGLAGRCQNSIELIDHFKSNLDGFFSFYKDNFPSPDADKLAAHIVLAKALINRRKMFVLGGYLSALIEFTEYVASGKPFAGAAKIVDSTSLQRGKRSIIEALNR